MVQNFTFDDLEDIWFRDDDGACSKEEIEIEEEAEPWED